MESSCLSRGGQGVPRARGISSCSSHEARAVDSARCPKTHLSIVRLFHYINSPTRKFVPNFCKILVKTRLNKAIINRS